MTPQNRIKTAQRELLEAQKELKVVLEKTKTRARAPAVRMLHEVRRMLHPAYPYASQAGQDQIIDRIMKGKRGGTFIDVGAYDGVNGSNTLFLEKWRDWSGVLVEPVEEQRNRAAIARSASCLPYAVAASDGEAEFMTITQGYTQMSGLLGTYDAKLLKQVRADKRHKETTSNVETKTLSGVLEEVQIEHPDFISLDIEGGELSVLEDFPFDKHKVGAWAIENNTGTPKLGQMMLAKGYKVVEFCGPDEVFAHESILN